jgi:hypothetical protein
MKFELFTQVAFSVDVPEHRIKKGDIATIVEYFDKPEPGYALEVYNALGESIDVVAVPESSLEALSQNERLHVRHVEAL